MILTLTWKEYREHRSVWFTMVLLTGLLAFGAAQLSAPGNLEAISRMALAVLALAGAYGVVCGGMMLAGEREAGTLVFLDIFLGRRGVLWMWKCLIGVLLVLAEALVVALVLHFLKQDPPEWLRGLLGQGSGAGRGGVMPRGRITTQFWFLILPLVTLEAYAWGLLGSSLTRRVLPGAGLAVLMAAPVWLVAIFAPAPVFLGIRLFVAGIALVASLLVFLTQSRDATLGPTPKTEDAPHRMQRLYERHRHELERRAPQPSPRAAARGLEDVPIPVVEPRKEDIRAFRAQRRPAEATSPVQVILWLAFGQARVLAPVLAGAALVAGFLVPAYGQVLWPLATLLLGVACGMAVFVQEQSDLSYQFLAAQHIPLKTIWNVKMMFWAIAAVLACGVLLVGGLLTVLVNAMSAPVRRPGFGDPAAVPQVGFVFGALRDSLGPVLFFTVWLVYGFCAGQLFVLLCRKAILAVVLSTLVAVGALSLWLPSLFCLGMSGWQLWLAPLLALAASRLLLRAWAGGRVKERRPLTALIGFGMVALVWAGLVFTLRAWDIPDVGEPLDRAAFRDSIPTGEKNVAGQKIQEALGEVADAKGEVAPWLDRLTEAAQLPLGVLEAPREGQAPILRHLPACRIMTESLLALARTAQEKEPGTSVDRLGQILLLSRHLRNKASLVSYLAGVEAEASALQGLEQWLAHGKPAPNHLERVRDLLERHATGTPTPLDCLQTECFRAGGLLDNPAAWSFRVGGGGDRVPETWLADAIALSLDMPWENERKNRLWRSVWEGLFRTIRAPSWQPLETGDVPEARKEATRRILRGWLPATEGAGASLTTARLARLLDDSWLADERLFAQVLPLRNAGIHSQWRVDSARLAAALGLYQLQHEKTAQKLEELVPNYLPKLPVDPYTGQAFRYRISQGEEIEVMRPGWQEKVKVQAGQGILWSTGPDRVDHGGRKHWEAPVEDHPWWPGDVDLVTIIPHW